MGNSMMMKFMVCCREDKMAMMRMPQTEMMEMYSMSCMYMEDMKKQGKVLEWGCSGPERTIFAICSVKSASELCEMIEMMPCRPMCTVEQYPWMDAMEFAESCKKIKKECAVPAEKMKKMMMTMAGN